MPNNFYPHTIKSMFFSGLAVITFLPFPTATPDQMPLRSGTTLRVKSQQGRSVYSGKTQTSGNNLTRPPQTQGKIERWHQTLKNHILLENYFLPRDLEALNEAFTGHYNHQRFHESLNNVTLSDVYFGLDKDILQQRERIKQKTLEARRLHHRQRAA